MLELIAMKQSNNETIRILLAGEGGQGIQTIAKALSEAAAMLGEEVSYIPLFGVEQRGTPSISFVTISDAQIRYPRFDIADILVVLRSRAIPRISQYISPHTLVIFDSSTVDSSLFPKQSLNFRAIPATKIASEKFHPKSFNIIILGILSKILDIDADAVWSAALDSLGAKLKDNKIKEMNHQAFIYGYEAVLEEKTFSKALYETKKTKNIYKNSERIAEIDPSLCKGCGICIEKCPVKALSFGEDIGYFALPVPTIDLNKCIACGNCRRFCPDGAIGVDKINQR